MRKPLPTKVALIIQFLILLTAISCFAAEQEVAIPAPELQDFVTHNKGNITTTVNNWGQVGGLGHLGYPSGEWPKGSGHYYLAEIKYWMGATVAGGDKNVVHTDNDFRPIPHLAQGKESYNIRLSTDINTYDYDETDTVGIGVGAAAHGWRVWDPETRAWVYNQVWDIQTEQFVQGGPSALQESIFRFSDDDLSNGLGLEMTHHIYQWNYSYNQDYMFVVLEITNTSENDYIDFAFGLYCDFDIGGPDGTGENGRLGDLVAMDNEENLAWTYDADGFDRGWGPTVTTGVMGTRYIETPDNIGMTAFRTGQWEFVPVDDVEQYNFISENVFDEPLPPTDQYYLQCTSGISLESGKTIRIGYALIAGYDEADFRRKAQMAQAVYNNHFVGPAPPNPAKLSARVGENEARLIWDGTAEKSIDPMSGIEDFAGFKIYRSADMGLSWGKLERHPDGSLGPDYVPLATWRIDNLSEPIPHTYVDTDLTNGFEYWYSVVAFDKGDSTAGVDVLQTAYGQPENDQNAVAVIPRTDPIGYYFIQETLTHEHSGDGKKSVGELTALLFDNLQLTGDEYKVGFKENPYETTWYIVNKTTGDTLLNDQVMEIHDEATAPVVDGIRLMLTDGELVESYYNQVGFANSGDTTLHLGYTYGPTAVAFGLPIGGGIHFRQTYQLRFTDTGSEGYSFYDDVTPIQLPFEIWNMNTNQQVLAEIFHLDSGFPNWNPANRDYIVVVNVPYDGSPHPEAYPYFDSWFFRMDQADTNYASGDIFEVGGALLNGAGDKFLFKAPGVDHANAANQLDQIRVVPNPYIARASWENNEGEKRMEFTNLPEKAKVRIYTLAGDLVQTLEHEGSGTLVWNMLSKNNQGIAPGLYFYHVESSVGNKTGKFAIIK